MITTLASGAPQRLGPRTEVFGTRSRRTGVLHQAAVPAVAPGRAGVGTGGALLRPHLDIRSIREGLTMVA
ncbi:hypothetical protein BJP40_12455 [Streptomyces sp. CC53]|nr:hypothetical protein BJP40_12455 [Streptomyces sp. CC53]